MDDCEIIDNGTYIDNKNNYDRSNTGKLGCSSYRMKRGEAPANQINIKREEEDTEGVLPLNNNQY